MRYTLDAFLLHHSVGAQAAMEFRILGPLYVDAGTGRGPALIRQPLLRSTMAVLLLRANMTCPTSLLTQALWAGEPPAAPDAALRVSICRLRQCLGDAASRLSTVGPPGGRAPSYRQRRGYVMAVRPGELDVDEFTDLSAQGQAELDAGNATSAAASFVQALALWGDPPLPDLPDNDAVGDAIAKLNNQRRGVADGLVDARLAAGDYEQVLGQLRGTVLADPARERSSAQLMTACHALGLRKEALDVYQLARRAMLEQQGVEPGHALSLLYRRILAEEAVAASPVRVPTAARVAIGAQTPAPPADFTGRADEIAQVVGRLTASRRPVTVISGGPGIGKTSVAAAAALELRNYFADGQLYAELGGVERPRDPQEVLAGILETLGIPERAVPPPGPPRTALYRSLLAERNVLVIADDAATAAQVRPLVPAAGGAAVLVTSRGRLSALAGASVIELGALPDEDAFRLLDSAAGPDRVGGSLAEARAIVAACAGMPLAVRLAGSILAARPGLSVARLAADIARQPLDVLAADDVSVRAAIGSSYAAVSARARAALSMAAVNMPGNVPAWALTELAGGDERVIAELMGVGLIAPLHEVIAVELYGIHSLIRTYAAAQPDEDRSHNSATGSA
jgi:DNA-binding SARP family transcriptional activator